MRTAFLGLLLWLCGAAVAAEPINDIAAVVEDHAITRLDILRQIERAEFQGETITEKEALDILIDRQVQIARAHAFGIDISPSRLNTRLAQVRLQLEAESGEEFPTDAAYIDFLESTYGLPIDVLKQEIAEDMMIQAVFASDVISKITIPQAEVDQFLYKETEAGVAPRYHLQFLLVEIDSDIDERSEAELLEVALTLRAAMQEDGDVFAVAKRFADDKRIVGDDLGLREESELPDDFVRAIQELDTGEVADVLRTGRGFYVLKLAERRGGELLDEIVRFKIAHVFLPLEKAARAQEIADEIRGGTIGFADAVRQYSIDERSVGSGGDLGWFPTSRLPAYFYDTVQALDKGDTSDAIESPYGMHILQLSDKEVTKIDLAAARERMTDLLRQRRAVSSRDSWLEKLRSETYVRILNPAYL